MHVLFIKNKKRNKRKVVYLTTTLERLYLDAVVYVCNSEKTLSTEKTTFFHCIAKRINLQNINIK